MRFCGFEIGLDRTPLIVAGPCALESRDMAMATAQRLAEICARAGAPFIFKASFDKANRTSGATARGLGIDSGLRVLAEIRERLGAPVLTDIHWPQQAATAAAAVDVLQVPAFLCRQTDLIAACAKTGKAINIKKGQFLSPSEALAAAAKARAAGAAEVALCERGTTFGYHNLVVDMRGLARMGESDFPVIFDATHSAQLPGAAGESSGGEREMAAVLARAAAAAGVSGFFIETHPDPKTAISDRETQWPLDRFEDLLESILRIDRARKESENA